MRLIGGNAEFLLGIDIIGGLCIAVDFGERNFHILNVEWELVTRSGGLWAFPLAPTARGYTPAAGYFAKIGISI